MVRGIGVREQPGVKEHQTKVGAWDEEAGDTAEENDGGEGAVGRRGEGAVGR